LLPRSSRSHVDFRQILWCRLWDRAVSVIGCCASEAGPLMMWLCGTFRAPLFSPLDPNPV
jgi:hypothetical protein